MKRCVQRWKLRTTRCLEWNKAGKVKSTLSLKGDKPLSGRVFFCCDFYLEKLFAESAFFIILHLLQALHPLQTPQLAQLPPKELLPAFLSRIMLRISNPVISTITVIRTILIRFVESQVNIESHPYKKGGSAVRAEVDTHTAQPNEEKGSERLFTERSAFVLPCKA